MARTTQNTTDPLASRPSPGDRLEVEALEERLSRLEQAIASLQESHGLEHRPAERIERELEVRRADPPAQQDKVTSRTNFAVPFLASFLPPPRSAEEASVNSEDIARLPAPLLGAMPPAAHEAFWAWEVLRELRTMFRMFFDVTYRVAWWVRIFVLIMVPGLLLAHWWLPLSNVDLFLGFPGRIFEKLVVLLLGFFLYKVLSREARRYQAYEGLKQQAATAAELRQQVEATTRSA